MRSAEDGFTALVAIEQKTPDILLSDLNMPGISGFELLSRSPYPVFRDSSNRYEWELFRCRHTAWRLR